MRKLIGAVLIACTCGSPLFAQDPEPKQPGDPAKTVITLPHPGYRLEPLTPRQKSEIFLRHSYSPLTVARAGLTAGLSQALDTHEGYGQGMEGFGKRLGAAVADSESGVFFQRFLLPVVFKQDPRYIRLPERSGGQRVGYALSRIVVGRKDDGRTTFNFAHVGGAFASRSLSNLYYPENERTVGDTCVRAGTSLAVDAGMNLLREFWPDIRRKLRGGSK